MRTTVNRIITMATEQIAKGEDPIDAIESATYAVATTPAARSMAQRLALSYLAKLEREAA